MFIFCAQCCPVPEEKYYVLLSDDVLIFYFLFCQFVTIKRGSLETTTEALHPHMRHRSLRYLKAGYTAGSMAGLGFSMAILGTCMGIFVGFLLWKRHTSVPYQVTE